MELNRNPDNYFAEVEQAAFSPSNIVPGIGFQPGQDAAGAGLLLCRCAPLSARHALRGAARSMRRNAPCTTITRTAPCGSFRNDTGNPDAYYEPNSFGGPKQDPSVAEPPLHISGDAARYDHREGNDDFIQPRALFLLFDAGQRQRLFSNIAAAMQGVPEPIVERQLGLFDRVDPAYGAGVRAALAEKKAVVAAKR